jgi:hypothetical protein
MEGEKDFEDYEDHYEPDPLEEAMEECGSYLTDDRYFVCSLAGTEHCDFSCPFRDELGTQPESCDHGASTLEGEQWICDDCGEVVND